MHRQHVQPGTAVQEALGKPQPSLGSRMRYQGGAAVSGRGTVSPRLSLQQIAPASRGRGALSPPRAEAALPMNIYQYPVEAPAAPLSLSPPLLAESGPSLCRKIFTVARS